MHLVHVTWCMTLILTWSGTRRLLWQVQSLLAGSDNSAAVFQDGRVFVWGKNERGALGLDDTRDRFSPTLLFTIHGLPIKELAVGDGHMVALIATQSSREPEDTTTDVPSKSAHGSSPPSPISSPGAAGGVEELKRRGSNSRMKSRTPSPQTKSRSASPVNVR